MSFYTEKNGLAQFWNRDMTRLEWAKWVYHHPEQTEKLVELLLGKTDLSAIEDRISVIEQIDKQQNSELTTLRNNSSISSITIAQLEELLARDPDMDGVTESVLDEILRRLNENDVIDAQQAAAIAAIGGPATIEELAQLLQHEENSDAEIDSLTKEQLDYLLNKYEEDE